MNSGFKYIDQFEVMNLIGKGGWGEVYRVKSETGKEFALKYYLPSIKIENVEFLYKRTKDFNHKNLLSPISFGQISNRAYTVLPLCDGSLMDEIIKRKRFTKKIGENYFSEDQIATIVGDITQGLLYLTEKGYMHGDIKPDNILFIGNDINRQFLISDFDILNESIGLGGDDLMKSINSIGLAQAYAGPERFNGRIHKNSDVFSIGITIFELLTGKYPFEDLKSSLGEKLNMDLSNNELFKKDLDNLAITKRLNNLMLECLRPSPAERLTIDELSEIALFKKEKRAWPNIPSKKSKNSSLNSQNIESITVRSSSSVKMKYSLAIIILFLLCWFGYEKHQLNNINSSFYGLGLVNESIEMIEQGHFYMLSFSASKMKDKIIEISKQSDKIYAFRGGFSIGLTQKKYTIIDKEGEFAFANQGIDKYYDVIYQIEDSVYILMDLSNEVCSKIYLCNSVNCKSFSAKTIYSADKRESTLSYRDCANKLIIKNYKNI